MKANIVKMRRFSQNDLAFDIALPVIAYQCEVTPPLPRYLDAYEEVVLKLVGMGIDINNPVGKKGICNTLQMSEAMVDRVLQQLEEKNKIEKKSGQPWILTEEGIKYLNGDREELQSKDHKIGYMFVNAINKKVIPYFYEGDVESITPYSNLNINPLNTRLTIENSLEKTFTETKPKRRKLMNAYKLFVHNEDVKARMNEHEITRSEAADEIEDLFSDLDYFDEEDDEYFVNDVEDAEMTLSDKESSTVEHKKFFVRKLSKKPTNLFIIMQLVVDVTRRGGYYVESPFDFLGLDNNYFLREIQWLLNHEKVYLGDVLFSNVVMNEVQKIAPMYGEHQKDFSVYIIDKLPRLTVNKSRYADIYNDLEQIYEMMLIADRRIIKENIVNDIYKYVLEKLFNFYYIGLSNKKLEGISQRAIDRIAQLHSIKKYAVEVTRKCSVSEQEIWIGHNAIKRIPYTHGNSIWEKFCNLFVVNQYVTVDSIQRLIYDSDVLRISELTDEINQIRKKVVHDTKDVFTDSDYEYFIGNVFELIDMLLKSFEEE